MEEKTFYCVKCREKTTTTSDYEVTKTSNGRRMARTTCQKCGTKVVQFMK